MGSLRGERLAQMPGSWCGRATSLTEDIGLLTLDNEIGRVNVIVWRFLRQQQRRKLLHSRLLAVYGVWQREGKCPNLLLDGYTTSCHCWGGWQLNV